MREAHNGSDDLPPSRSEGAIHIIQEEFAWVKKERQAGRSWRACCQAA